jgi:putative transposase
VQLFTFIRLFLSSHTAVIAENLFLRKQLGLFQERKVKSRRATAATRAFMVLLSRFFNWREALVIVRPETFLKWHRTVFRRLWGWKSRKRGGPRLPKNLRELVREMAHDNPTWGEERIANELKLKLGIRVSPRTVSKYLAGKRPGDGTDQRWATFVRNQATAIVACGFFISVTLSFRVLYIFVAMELGSRRILHCNVTAHPTAE